MFTSLVATRELKIASYLQYVEAIVRRWDEVIWSIPRVAFVNVPSGRVFRNVRDLVGDLDEETLSKLEDLFGSRAHEVVVNRQLNALVPATKYGCCSEDVACVLEPVLYYGSTRSFRSFDLAVVKGEFIRLVELKTLVGRGSQEAILAHLPSFMEKMADHYFKFSGP